MRKPATQAALPIIEVIQSGKAWEVHWDYQEAPRVPGRLYRWRDGRDRHCA
jgi:hypothetical protein